MAEYMNCINIFTLDIQREKVFNLDDLEPCEAPPQDSGCLNKRPPGASYVFYSVLGG
jgi:hypothetical protein